MSKKETTIKALKKKNKKLKAELAKLKPKSKSKSAAKSKAPAKAKSADKKKAPAKPERMKVVAKEPGLKSEPAPVRVVAGGSA